MARRISQAGTKAMFASFLSHKPLPFLFSLEPVSDPSIQILSWELANGSCTITVNCTAERGDSVSYSWEGWDAGTSGLCTHNGSLLHLSYPLQNSSIDCACTASNPISRGVVPFKSFECSYEQGGKSPSADVALSSLLVLLSLCRGLFRAVLGSLKGVFHRESGPGLLSPPCKCWPQSCGSHLPPQAARPPRSGAQIFF